MKKVFTTGQVAKICKVAPRTVSKWFDSGRLKGYRIPGSQDRRIPREQLIRFLKEHGMPLGELEEEEWHKILVIGAEKLFIDRLKELLPEDEDYKYEIANSGFEAGIQAESFHPDTIIIDLGLDFVLVPAMGVNGAALASALAYSAAILGAIAVFLRDTRTTPADVFRFGRADVEDYRSLFGRLRAVVGRSPAAPGG